MMAPRGLYIFSHESKLGKAPAHKRFERIQVERKDSVEVPRRFEDYDVTVNESDMPQGVNLTQLL